uniref:Uncharacterized protein n=1 Tax=Acrobeloides nanus TaxID=290746 RepID=A0A914EC56_9BILA
MRRGFFLPKKDDPDGGKSLKDVKQENPKNEIPKIPNLNAGTMQKTTSEKLDSHILSRIFVQFLTLKEETKPHREISNRRPYRIFLLNKTLYDEILDYDNSDFDLRDRTLALRSAKRELYHFAT